MIANFKSIFDLLKEFPTEQHCIDHLEKLRWNGNVISPFDETSKVYKCKGNKYRCKNSKKYFNVKTDTIFDDSKIPLQKWFLSLYLFSSHKKGISSHQLSKDITVTQKTAWYMLHRLRYAFEHPAFRELMGGWDDNDGGIIVEVDETYVSGKNKNRHAKKKTKGLSGTAGKAIVFGALERNGVLQCKVIKNVKASTLKLALRETVKEKSVVCTDELASYNSIGDRYYRVKTNHSAGKYVDGAIHTNGIECAWSHFKRGLYGIYHHVSEQHLQSYVDEFTLRYNTRKTDTADRFDIILSNVAGRKLTYQTLINKA